ncbi:hypothetical protein EO087_01550 [Dyella sp. M7H15-1]|uniref:hypothetical protein n=1 Tax=Dyella sp. M7H15-1 TaxID=2501295 RepID=UPI001004FBA7|nr:hypothetical protein [Dyella sp. M7H15-1]QAU22831.1 hypothetical protein EO087_01550 [Dyella sp. M7H15-1]
MSLIKEAWESLRIVATLIDKMEGYNDELKALRTDVRDVRERLVAVETIIAFARGTTPKLPSGA